MEQPILISHLNDFIFCPVSIYFHSLERETDEIMLKDTWQLNGSKAHEKSDTARYSSKKNVLQGISVYSERYNLFGKIDVFDQEKGVLTERKKKIKTVYDGYVFQLYAQCFALQDMGYSVEKIQLYSMDDNKVHPLSLPDENSSMVKKFKSLLLQINAFDFKSFKQENIKKCGNCIYEEMCSYSGLKGV